MINKLIDFSIRNKFIIGLFTLALIAWGSYSIKQIPIDAVPDITNNQVQIITQMPDLAAPEVEQQITIPIEKATQFIPGVIEVRSISRFGLSVVTVVFNDDMGIYLPQQLVEHKLSEIKEKITKNDLGNLEVAPLSTGLGEVYQYVLKADSSSKKKYTAMDLRSIQDRIVKPQFGGIEGVVDVNSFGGYLKQIEVAINPELLKNKGVSFAEVFDALEKNNKNTGGSYIEKGSENIYIRSIGQISSMEDIRKISIKNNKGNPLLIEHIAEVKIGYAPRFGAMGRNGEGEVAGGMVLMMKGSNANKVVARIKERLITIKKSLPEGIELIPFIDRSELIGRTTSTVFTNLLEGGLIVIFILVLLLGNFRAGLIVASVIPLSLLFAISLMNLFGVSANLMSLGALDFGIVVDGAVIIVEAIILRLAKNRSGETLTQEEMDKEVREGASKIRISAAFGEIIILIVYLPILALVGIEGKMFRPMALTVSFAILGAFILSLTYVPMITSVFLKKNISPKKTIADSIMGFFQRLYIPILQLALKFKFIVLGLAAVIFIISIMTFSKMGAVFIPRLEEGDLVVSIAHKPGTSLTQILKTSNEVEKILMANVPEIEQMCSRIGTAEIPTDPMPIESADIFVVLKNKENWTSASTLPELVDIIKREISVVPGINVEISQPIEHMFNTLISGVRSDIAIKLYGENLDILDAKAKEIQQLISGINGIGDVKPEEIKGMPQVAITYKKQALAKYGLNIEEISDVVQAGFGGKTTGVLFEEEWPVDIVMRLDSAHRKDIKDIENMYVYLSDGNQIPLKEIANIDYIKAPVQVSRDNAKRRVVIGVNVRNRDIETLVTEIQNKLDAELDLPAGYYLKYGGQFENLQNAKDRLLIAVPIALILIFILLFFTFNSIKQALFIFTAIPLAAMGGIAALWIRQMPFSISAGIGFIALFGVAVLNGIVLIAYFNQLKKEGVTNTMERIITGAKVRLRPVIMTASVAALGFLPMAISTGDGAEVQQPLATVVIGGLVSATLLTLLVLPILYALFDTKKTKSHE